MKTTPLKKTLLLLACAGLCHLPRAFSSEPSPDLAGRFYFTAHGGVAWLENVAYRNDAGSGTLWFDPGARLDVAGGYLLTPALGVEVETGITYNRARGFVGTGFFDEDSVYLVQIPLLANLNWRIPTRWRLKPFISAGLGGVYTQLQDWSFLSDESSHDFTFGFQGAAGLRYQINARTELGLAYKFMGTTDHQLEHMDGTRSHSVLFSFSMKF